ERGVPRVHDTPDNLVEVHELRARSKSCGKDAASCLEVPGNPDRTVIPMPQRLDAPAVGWRSSPLDTREREVDRGQSAPQLVATQRNLAQAANQAPGPEALNCGGTDSGPRCEQPERVEHHSQRSVSR